MPMFSPQGEFEPIDDPEGGGKAANVAATYSGADKRCQNCEFFDGDARCNLGNIDVEPEGRCDEFSLMGGEDSPGYEESAEPDFEEIEE